MFCKNLKDRGLELDIDILIVLDDERRKLVTKISEMNAVRNENDNAMRGEIDDSNRQSLIESGKALKLEITALEEKLEHITSKLLVEHKKIPNICT